MICRYCSTDLPVGALFCGECGRAVSAEPPARSSPPARPPEPAPAAELDPFPWWVREPESLVPAVVPSPGTEPPGPPVTAVGNQVENDVENDVEGDVEETRLVDRTARGERFILQFSTGESVTVTGTGLVGRNPVAEPGEYFDAFVTIADPARSVSKTHLEFGQEAGAFWVSDRFSGNGTVVREPDRGPRRCDPGKRYRVMRGGRVEIGEQFFIVS